MRLALVAGRRPVAARPPAPCPRGAGALRLRAQARRRPDHRSFIGAVTPGLEGAAGKEAGGDARGEPSSSSSSSSDEGEEDGWFALDGDGDGEAADDEFDVDEDDDAGEGGLAHPGFDPFEGRGGGVSDGEGRSGDGAPSSEDEDDADGGDDWPPPALVSAAGEAVLPPAAGGDVAAYVDAVLAGAGGNKPPPRASTTTTDPAGTPPPSSSPLLHPPPPPLSTVAGMFPYRLDPFQRRAVRHALAGSNVLVCAPTGAGKTAIAAAAALGTLARGQRVIYTTPLKALSNQKLAEFKAVFGAGRVGLQTGDATLNAEGDIVVMTTEVLRNILYRADPEAEAAAAAAAAEAASAAAAEPDGGGGDGDADSPPPPPPSPPPSSVPARVADVGLIVLDEVHYLGDASRGTVWEETIIAAPRGTALLAMSATVRNPADLGDWMASVHAPTVTLRTAARPVPLNWLYAWGTPSRWAPPYAGARSVPGEGAAVDDLLTFDRVAPGRPGRLAPRLRPPRGGGTPTPRAPPDPAALARALDARDLLPAIWFIFSRAGCDGTARSLAAARAVRPPPPASAAAIAAALAALRSDQPEAVREDMVPALAAGIASHHAGCLPGWKSLVEKLFQGGHLRLVVATETLAAGINMPARTTVISSLVRRRGAEGLAPLKHNELLQMAGRAGRRGFDAVGHCVIVHGGGPAGGPGTAAALIARGPERLASQFRPGYSMVLNLLATRSLPDARAFVERSFGAYLGGEGAARRAAQVAAAEALADDLEAGAEAAAAAASAAAASPDASATARKKEARRVLRGLERAAVADRAVRAAAALGGGGGGGDGDGDGGLPSLLLPRLVLLDLTAADPDGAEAAPALVVRASSDWGGRPVAVGSGDASDSENGGDAPPQPLPSDSSSNDGDVALPRPPAPGEPPGELLCLLDDNRCVRVRAAHVAAVAPAPPPAAWLAAHGGAAGVSAAVAGVAAAAAAGGGWTGVPGGALAAPGGGATAALAATLGDLAVSGACGGLDLLLPAAAAAVALKNARSEVRVPRTAARRESRLSRGAATAGGKGRKDGKCGGGAQQPPPDDASRLEAAAWAAAREARAARSTARAMRAALEEGAAATWRSFEAVAGVLVGAGAVEEVVAVSGSGGLTPPPSMRLLPLGEVARCLHGENELWLATLLASPGVQALPPPELAGVLSAVLAGELGLRPGVRARYPPSPSVIEALEDAEPARADLSRLQWRHGVDAPLAIDARLSGVVQAWASGLEWGDAVADCALDPGDVARLMSRTVDLLRQAGHCEALPPGLRAAARAAAKACDRKPIADLVV
jgi:superfamily II RNA helicase